jgi:hypothetical protein
MKDHNMGHIRDGLNHSLCHTILMVSVRPSKVKDLLRIVDMMNKRVGI